MFGITILVKKIIRKGFKFRLNPTSEQTQKFIEFSGVNRFVWNKALAINLSRLESKQPILWYNEMDFWSKLWKASDEYSFLKTVHSQTIQQTLKNLERAFKDGFDKTQPLKRIPKFKRKGQSDSFKYPQGFKVEQQSNKVFLPKIGWVSYRNSRQIIGDLKNCTVSRRGKYWYVAVQTEYEAEIQHHQSTSMIGIDLGITRFATLSDGAYIEPLNSFRQLSKKLAFVQKRLSKKVKFSANWKKQKQQVSKIHENIANARLDFLHKTSSDISKNHAMIVVEDLRVKNMSKSAKGDMTRPGKNVKAKSGLNKSILDQGWSMFVTMLEYKQAWSGGDMLRVNPQYTSQTCPCCNHVSKENRKSQSAFECTECGFKANADYVGALNILARGHRVLACGVESLDLTMKQELVGSSDTYPLLSA
jgi:putative transposase